VFSPFLTKLKVEKFINSGDVRNALNRNVKIVAVTRPPDRGEVDDVKEHSECIKNAQRS